MPQNFTNEKINIDSGNGLLLPGNKPLPESMLTQIDVIIWSTRPQWVKCHIHMSDVNSTKLL